jgi:hypothetical protein
MTDTKKREYSHESETGHFNFSPAAFRRWANQFYQCRQSFQCPDFSPVPYFLLCLAIELQFKAVHLENKGKNEVKEYGHNLIKSYEALLAAYRTLSIEQLELLKKADEIYSRKGVNAKGFEYPNTGDALIAFSNFPNLQALDALAEAIMTAPPFVQPGT